MKISFYYVVLRLPENDKHSVNKSYADIGNIRKLFDNWNSCVAQLAARVRVSSYCAATSLSGADIFLSKKKLEFLSTFFKL